MADSRRRGPMSLFGYPLRCSLCSRFNVTRAASVVHPNACRISVVVSVGLSRYKSLALLIRERLLPCRGLREDRTLSPSLPLLQARHAVTKFVSSFVPPSTRANL